MYDSSPSGRRIRRGLLAAPLLLLLCLTLGISLAAAHTAGANEPAPAAQQQATIYLPLLFGLDAAAADGAYHYSFSDPTISMVQFQNTYSAGGVPSVRVSAQVRIDGRQQWEPAEDWSALPERRYCRDLRAERVVEMRITLHPLEPEAADPPAAPTLKLSNIGCAGWSGEVIYSYLSEDPSGDWAENHSTSVSFRPAAWPAAIPEELRMGLFMRPEPAEMRARFSGFGFDESDPPRRCTYDSSFSFPIVVEDSYLLVALDGSRRYSGEGWVPAQEELHIQDSCGPNTLFVDLRKWWSAAVTVEEADQLKIAPDGRTISGSYTDGAGGTYSWTLRALPPE